jgi:hypothetical protein
MVNQGKLLKYQNIRCIACSLSLLWHVKICDQNIAISFYRNIVCENVVANNRIHQLLLADYAAKILSRSLKKVKNRVVLILNM